MLAQMLPLLVLRDGAETFVPFFSWRGILFPLPPKAVCSQRKVMLPLATAIAPYQKVTQTLFLGFFGSLLKASPKNKPFYIFAIALEEKKVL